jgi:adenylate cyclase
VRRSTSEPIDRSYPALLSAVDAALVEQARRNELALALVRAVGSALYGLAYVSTAVSRGALGQMPPSILVFVLGIALGSSLFFWLLAGGWYHRLVPWVTPLVDTLLIFIGIANAVRLFGGEGYVQAGGGVEIALVTALLITAGALRLNPRIALMSSASAFVMYATFALWLSPPRNIAMHFPVILGIAMASYFLALLVQRAVSSEVGKLVLHRFLPTGVVSRALSDPQALLAAPRSARATIIMTDLRGFTSYAEGRDPQEVFTFLSRIQAELATIVSEHGGSVDKFLGDGMLAEFGAVEPHGDHGARAVRAAAAMLAAIARMSRASGAELRLGIGIHTGDVVVGCLGGDHRVEFTVIGDAVNVASRLEELTKQKDVDVLLSATTVEELRAVEDDAVSSLRHLESVQLRGRTQALAIYTIEAHDRGGSRRSPKTLLGSDDRKRHLVKDPADG